MSKSLYVIAGLGLTGCVVMSMMMQHVLKVKGDKDAPPVVKDLEDLYGSRFREPCTVELAETEDHTRIEVGIRPVAGMTSPSLARDVGEFVWRRYAVRQVIDEVVVTLEHVGRNAEELSVPAPLLARRKYRAGELPARVPIAPSTAPDAQPLRSGAPPAVPVPGGTRR